MESSDNLTENAEVVACHECDLLMRLSDFPSGNKACCPRCGHVVTEKTENAKDKIMALATSSLIFLVFSLPFPFLSFESKGNERVITLIDSVLNMLSLDFDFIAILLLLTTIIIPGMFLLGILFVILSVSVNRVTKLTKSSLKLVFHLLDWNMAEIFLIGILVSFIKIASMANVDFGLSFAAYIMFIIFLVATASRLDRFQVWRWIKDSEG